MLRYRVRLTQRRIGLISLSIILSGVYFIWQKCVLSPDDLNEIYLYPEARQSAWTQSYPSSQDVEYRLSGYTFYMNNGANGEYITFFAANHKTYEWHNKQVDFGHWVVTTKLLPVIWNTRFQLKRVAVLCIDTPILAADSCRIARTGNDVVYQGAIRTRGDPFNLKIIRDGAPLNLMGAKNINDYIASHNANSEEN